ncbi:MAG: signal peptidase II [Kiritimatiellia bacterium]|jgi:signal peptidase II|nr:signal peptidase II [Kiritimatiellia bacterium]
MRVPLLAALLVTADQISKYWAVARLQASGSVPVVPGLFSFSYVENQGAAWGMLAGRQVFLIGFSLATLIFMVWRRRALFGALHGRTAIMSLLFGGVTGNLIDRLRLGHVIDFLDFHWGDAHFPAFNVADSAICCGVFLYLIMQWRHDRQAARDRMTGPETGD